MHRTLLTRLTVGLIGSASVAAVLAPTAAGATPTGAIAAAAPTVVAQQVSPATAQRPYVVINRAPVGMVGPAAPAPIVLVGGLDTPGSQTRRAPDYRYDALGESNRKEGYVNEQDWAWRGAGEGAGAGAGTGAAYGAVIGGIIGAVGGGLIGFVVGVSFPPIIPLTVIGGALIGGAIGAGIGAGIGAIAGSIDGAISGYNEGIQNARWHNEKVKLNKGRPVLWPVAQQEFTLNGLQRSLPALAPSVPTYSPTVPRISPTVPAALPIPREAARVVDDAHRAIANLLPQPTRKRVR
ncbi:MAG: hypothetical protein QM728_14330 [Gordonia sp. (in: high G+C Gram-positive bacteria)]|uniref:hypothetical protein n=1 Tax=Gordonia sp. (in: high G+C Gram-positive bacteria) TaxID=84139 RepID=UPI0039E5D78E